MRSIVRIARGPKRAPGRLVTPRSVGTTMSATSRSVTSGAAGSPSKVGMPEYGLVRLPSGDCTCRPASISTGSSPSLKTSRSEKRARRSASFVGSICDVPSIYLIRLAIEVELGVPEHGTSGRDTPAVLLRYPSEPHPRPLPSSRATLHKTQHNFRAQHLG